MAETERIENEESGEVEMVEEPTPWDTVLSESNPEEEEEAEEEESLEGRTPEERLAILEERVTSRNRTLRQREKAIGRMQEEIGELRKGGEKLTPEMIAAIRGQQTAEESAPQPLISDDDRERLSEQFAEDPTKMVDFVFGKMDGMFGDFENKLVEALQRRDDVIAEKIKPPVAPEVKEAVERLKQDPEFAGMDDGTLEVIARKTLPALKKAARPPASITGRPASPKGAGAKAHRNSLLEKLGY